MEIAVIGTGYVGLVTGVCLSEIGHNVTCIDIDENKVKKMEAGISPIYEEGLEELLEKNIGKGRLHFTTDYQQGLKNKHVVYIAVGTPQGEDGSADLTYIDAACKDVAANLSQDSIIVTKSTVPVGTNEHIKQKISESLSADFSIEVASNPEFLRQGSAVYDTFNGDRIVIGSESEEVLDVLEEINQPFGIPIVRTDLRSAEMIKYASNAFLATKISFINEMANLCGKLGANIENVSRGMGMDNRIGPAFLNPGLGYGGSCFPKDTNAIISIARNVDYQMPILENVEYVNQRQRKIIVENIMKKYGSINGKKIALLGLSFKPNTDDMRESPSILIIEELVKEGAEIRAFDPAAAENAKQLLPSEVAYADSVEEAVTDADFAVIVTDWQQIKGYPLEKYKANMADPVIFDGRNCFNLQEVEKNGIEYYSIGRPPVPALEEAEKN